MSNKHVFAIFFESIDKFLNDQIICINDSQFYQRIVKVLRLQINDELILFNKKINIDLKIINLNKKEIFFEPISYRENKEFKHKITFLISLLKKDAFEQSIYNCVELGANVIQPIITEKTHNKKITENEIARLNKILISAAEQSKNFNFPQLNEPIQFPELIKQLKQEKETNKIYFDAAGKNIEFVLTEFKDRKNFILMTGPEGDLTDSEKEILKNNGFACCALTPTILRSQTAVVLGLGIFRSVFH